MTPEEDKKITRAEVEKKLEELKAEIAELKAWHDEKPKPPHPRWRPDRYQRYYSINQQSCIIQNMWNDSLWDEDAYSIDNVFATKEAAEFAIEHMKVTAEMREWAGDQYDGVYMYYQREYDEIRYCDSGAYCFDGIRFNCVDDAQNCVNAVGKERIKKYYFLIQEDEA